MYQWIVFIHIASVMGLLLVHPVTVAFHLKAERDDTRIRELLEVSEAASTLRHFMKSPLDPGRSYEGVAEIASVAGRARHHLLGHELKSKKVLADVLG